MKKLMILFAGGFPYGISEPFLEQETPLYGDYFDKVLLVTSCKRGEQPTRPVDGTLMEVLSDYTVSKDLRSILQALPWTLTDPMLWRELRMLLKQRKLSPRKLYDVLVTALCGNHMALLAARWQRTHAGYETAVIYSYWLRIPGYAAARLQARTRAACPSISRAHGFDVYLERHADGYIPFHRQIYQRLDLVAPVSEDGAAYLRAHYGMEDKVRVCRLGAACGGAAGPVADRQPLRVVSCARVVPLKRLERIADALQLISDRPIVWVHLGDGAGLDALRTYAAQTLPPNVRAEFRGGLSNKAVYETYRTEPFHLFLNVSETEGVPVAAMEAMHFGIPAVATAVGGTPDLIDDGVDGYLLPKAFRREELAKRLMEIADMPEADYLRLREAARAKIDRSYNAERNYRSFLEMCANGKN